MTSSVRRTLHRWVLGGAALLALTVTAPAGGALARPSTLPEFKHADPAFWVNSPPLTKAALRGKVVLIEVYTSG